MFEFWRLAILRFCEFLKTENRAKVQCCWAQWTCTEQCCWAQRTREETVLENNFYVWFLKNFLERNVNSLLVYLNSDNRKEIKDVWYVLFFNRAHHSYDTLTTDK